MKKIAVVRFLGTNCDRDVFEALKEVGLKPEWAWYEDQFDANKFEGAVLPGGFSYGDYLRSGALAAKSPVMNSVEELSKSGKPVLGICNGFQILCERRLLPGALLKNKNLKFVDKWSRLNSVADSGTWGFKEKHLDMPIAHGDGRYFIDQSDLKKIEDNQQVWFRYEANHNGSVSDIAGVLNDKKNVAGLMPHPERAIHDWMGGSNGRKLLERFL